MLYWVKTEILALGEVEYRILLLVFWGLCVWLLYRSYRNYQGYRFIAGTATSKIRSAAQGYVELVGIGELMPGDEIHSPFSQSRCLWYHCSIEKKQRSGRRSSWTHISDQVSDQIFHLLDDTGACVIDPEGAQVEPEVSRSWYGGNLRDSQRVPVSRLDPARLLGSHQFRFTERLIRPASPLYALGSFRSLTKTLHDSAINKQVEQVLQQWKLQPGKYLAVFDLDHNGKIQQQEWQVIRQAARQQVLAELRQQSRPLNLLVRPAEPDRPFLLSASSEESLVGGKKWRAFGALLLAFLLFVSIFSIIALRPLTH